MAAASGSSSAGQWTAPGKTFVTENPATGEKLADLAEGSREEVDAAVAAARAAFPAWSALSGYQRAKYLMRWRGWCRSTRGCSRCSNRSTTASRSARAGDIDIPLVAGHFTHHAGWAQHLERAFPEMVPYGVCGQIIPWNSRC